MNGMGLREKAIVATLAVVVMYVIAGIVWFVHSENAWKKSAKNYSKAKETFLREEKLIGEKTMWADAYEAEKATMPMFEDGKATDTTWLKKMDEIAAKNLVLIGQRQGKDEIEGDDVKELPIEVKSWEASLEALVKFMHELENTDEGMFDITEINFKPSSKKGYLRGSFTLNCAYMREK